jgi:hypothetical protein
VLIGGKPAARVNDLAHCNVPPPDKIRDGSPTVIIGGERAARRSDPTDIGFIKEGCETVIIGDHGMGEGECRCLIIGSKLAAPFLVPATKTGSPFVGGGPH